MEDDFDKVLVVLLGTYLLIVFSNGNAYKMAELLKKEKGYLEFILALMLVYYLTKYDKTGLVAPLVSLSGLAILLYSANYLNLSDLSKKFANGEISLFDTIFRTLKG